MTLHWVTTAPNPRSPATGPDAGQRGWKLHAVLAKDDTFTAIRQSPALCGLRARYGWGMDLFIEDRCQRCLSAVAKLRELVTAELGKLERP